MHPSLKDSPKNKKRESKNKTKNHTQTRSTREKEVLLFLSSCNILLPCISAAVRAAREPDGDVDNAGSLASSFLQVQRDCSKANAVCSLMSCFPVPNPSDL